MCTGDSRSLHRCCRHRHGTNGHASSVAYLSTSFRIGALPTRLCCICRSRILRTGDFSKSQPKCRRSRLQMTGSVLQEVLCSLSKRPSKSPPRPSRRRCYCAIHIRPLRPFRLRRSLDQKHLAPFYREFAAAPAASSPLRKEKLCRKRAVGERGEATAAVRWCSDKRRRHRLQRVLDKAAASSG